MNILLKPELEKFVTEKLIAGQFAYSNEVINEALEEFKEQEEFTPEHEAYRRREVKRGIEQLDRKQ